MNDALAAVPADRIALMQTFVRIVEAGSLSAAAAQMGATQPTVSRRLQTLERSLGVRLLQRSTRQLKLTEDGERCFERAKELLDGWQALEADLRGVGSAAEGLLRVVVPHAFGQERLIGPLAEYLRRYPGMAVEWLLHDDRAVQDYIAAGVDCAIQVGAVTDPGLVAIRLCEVPRIVAAAPEVFAKAPPPEDARDLAAYPWLALRTYYRNALTLTNAKTGEQRQLSLAPRFSTDSLYALRSTALQGLGLCVGSAWVLEPDLRSGRLLHVAPHWQAAPLPVSVVYPYARFYPARLRRFVEIIRAAAPAIFEGAAAGGLGKPRRGSKNKHG